MFKIPGKKIVLLMFKKRFSLVSQIVNNNYSTCLIKQICTAILASRMCKSKDFAHYRSTSCRLACRILNTVITIYICCGQRGYPAQSGTTAAPGVGRIFIMVPVVDGVYVYGIGYYCPLQCPVATISAGDKVSGSGGKNLLFRTNK